MLLRVLIEALKPFNKVLFLVVRKPLDDVHHEDPIAAVTQRRTQVEALVLGIVDQLGLGPPVDVVVEEDAFLKENVHLVVLGLGTCPAVRLLEDVEVKHLPKLADVDLVGLDSPRRLLLGDELALRVDEAVDEDLVALHVDAAQDAVVGHPHHNHLILVVAAVLLLEADAFGGELGLRVVGKLLLILATPIPESAAVEA